jgi:hypothetical protein
MEAPQFRGQTICDVATLSQVLEFSVNELIYLADCLDNFYIPNPLQENGRLTYSVKEPLKKVQGQIFRKILDTVWFPSYLQGGIKGTDYISDARLHVGCATIIHEDIKKFFDSIKFNHVFNVWQCFFGFSTEVSNLLTKLTTYHGFVPQGAQTSTYIANLVFWEKEPKVEKDFRQSGYIYSRFVDDIQISSRKNLNKDEKQTIISTVYGMMRSLDFYPKRKKHSIEGKRKKLTVHNLNINSGRPTLPKEERLRIRAAVKEIGESVKSGITEEAFDSKFASAYGRVKMMSHFHPGEAARYLDRLKAIKTEYLNAFAQIKT